MQEIDEKMYVPHVEIEYQSFPRSSLNTLTIPFSIETLYADNYDNVVSELKSYATILIIIGVISWIIRMYSYLQMHQADLSDSYYYETLYEGII